MVVGKRGADALPYDHAKKQRPIVAIGQVKDKDLTQVKWAEKGRSLILSSLEEHRNAFDEMGSQGYPYI